MTDTRDSYEKVISEMQEIHKESLWMYQLHHRIEEWADRLTALQSGAGDGGRYRKLVATGSFTPALNPERTPWGLRMSGTPATKKELDDAVDSCNAQATEGE